MWRLAFLLALALAAPCAGQPVARTPLFEFHSNFWVNLHHFLYEQAVNPPLNNPPEWREILAYYQANVITIDLLEDAAARTNNRLSQLESPTLPAGSGLDPGLAAALEAAAPIYRERWWPQHDRANRTWIAAVLPLLEAHASPIQTEIVRIYGEPWPATPILVDVAEYASWSGAYTSLGPTHITISSTDPTHQGNASLEMLFHEASHALIGSVRRTLAMEVTSRNILYRRANLWHAVIFYTAGELVRRRIPGYQPYADRNGIWERGWPGANSALAEGWQAYIDGAIDLPTAVRRLADVYGVAQ